jgi:twitching motility protein PilJ
MKFQKLRLSCSRFVSRLAVLLAACRLAGSCSQLTIGFENSWLTGARLDTLAGYVALWQLASIILIGLVMVRELTSALARSAEKSEQPSRNYASADEIGDLADGDLTVSATVTEDFTGAIADLDQLLD